MIGKIAVATEILTIFEVDNLDLGLDGGGFGFFGESDERMMGFGEIKIGDIRGGSALKTEDAEGFGDETGETEGGIMGSVFLVIGTFVRLVDNDEPEVRERRKEGGTGADDDIRGRSGGFEESEPGGAAFGKGLVGMDENGAPGEGMFEDFDELASEGDFGDEKDGRFLGLEGVFGEFKVDVGFATTGNALEKCSALSGALDGSESGFLGSVEQNGGIFGIFSGIFGILDGFG